MRGEDRHVVAVIGDGALTGGMAWEALNNIAVAKRQPAGHRRQRQRALLHADRRRPRHRAHRAAHQPALRAGPRRGQEAPQRRPRRRPGGVRRPARDEEGHEGRPRARRASSRTSASSTSAPSTVTTGAAMEQALTQAKRFDGPVIVHALTRKGFGYDAAEQHVADQFHAPGRSTSRPARRSRRAGSGPTSSPTRSSSIGAAAPGRRRDHRRDDAPGRPRPVRRPGSPSAPSTSASPSSTPRRRRPGLAMGGMHPVVAVYATFLNRAFDQVLMDVALHRCGVTFVLDRAGVTGDDGASHNGMWDMCVLQVVPGLRLAAPRDATRLRELLDEAVDVDDAPTVVRFPKGPPPADVEAVGRDGRLRRAAAQRHQGRAHRRRRLDGHHGRRGRPSGWSTRASASPSSTRAGSSRSTLRCVELARDPPAGGLDRGQRRHRRLRCRAAPDPQRGRRHHAGAAARHPAGVPRPRQARSDPRADRPDPADPGPRHRRDDVPTSAPTTPTTRSTDADLTSLTRARAPHRRGPPLASIVGRRRRSVSADRPDRERTAVSKLVHIVDDVPELDGLDELTLVVSLYGFLDAGNAAVAASDHLETVVRRRAGRRQGGGDLRRRPVPRLPRPPARRCRSSATTTSSTTHRGSLVRLHHDSAGTPFLLLRGPEPDNRWEAFCAAVLAVVERFGVTRVVADRRGADGGPAHPADRGHPARDADPSCSPASRRGAASCGSRPAPRRCSRCAWASGDTTRSATSPTCRTTSPSSTTRGPRSRCSRRSSAAAGSPST